MGNEEIEELKRENSNLKIQMSARVENIKNLQHSLNNIQQNQNQYTINTINYYQNQLNQQSIHYENLLEQNKNQYESLLRQQNELLFKDKNISSQAEKSQFETNRQMQELLLTMQKEQKN